MLPYIRIGQITISTYYTAMVIGYITMIVIMSQKNRRVKYNLGRIQSLLFATIELFIGVLGCKILFVLENISWIQKNGMTLGGFSFYGAVFLSYLVMPFSGKILSLDWHDSLDNAAICILSMLTTIRLGCFLNGCCGGRVFRIKDYYFSFPTQLIEYICDFFILSFLLECEKQNTKKGDLYPIFLFLYGSSRFFIEFLRNTERDWLYLSHAQWFSIVAIIMAIVFETRQKKRRN